MLLFVLIYFRYSLYARAVSCTVIQNIKSARYFVHVSIKIYKKSPLKIVSTHFIPVKYQWKFYDVKSTSYFFQNN